MGPAFHRTKFCNLVPIWYRFLGPERICGITRQHQSDTGFMFTSEAAVRIKGMLCRVTPHLNQKSFAGTGTRTQSNVHTFQKTKSREEYCDDYLKGLIDLNRLFYYFIILTASALHSRLSKVKQFECIQPSELKLQTLIALDSTW